MKFKYVMLFWISFCFSIIPQWNPLQSGLPQWGVQGYALDAYDSQIAVIAVNPSPPSFNLYKTQNGGIDWTGINLPSNLSFIDIDVVNENVIIGCSATPPQIWGTTDNGLNWQLLFDAHTTTNFLNYIEMFDLSNGIAMGDALNDSTAMMFYKTYDGGQNWQPIVSNLVGSIASYDWRSIDFINVNLGYYYDGITRKLYKTNNSGSDWVEVLDFTSTAAPTLIKFYNESIGILALSYSNQILKTVDGGLNWTSYSIPNNSIADDIEFLPSDPMKLWLVTMSELFFSSDGGTNWQTDPIAGSFQFGRDMVITNSVGWFLCEYVYRNENIDQVTHVLSEDLTTPNLFILNQNYPNPFNPITIISWESPINCWQTIKVYDVIGNQLATLVDEFRTSGKYYVKFDATFLASGIYYYQLIAGSYKSTRKMILIK